MPKSSLRTELVLEALRGPRDLSRPHRPTRRAEPSSSSSRDGITPIVVIRASVSNPRWPSRGATRKRHETQARICPLKRGNSKQNDPVTDGGTHDDRLERNRGSNGPVMRGSEIRSAGVPVAGRRRERSE